MNIHGGGTGPHFMNSEKLLGITPEGRLTASARESVGDEFIDAVHEAQSVLTHDAKNVPLRYRQSALKLNAEQKAKLKTAMDTLDAHIKPLDAGYERPTTRKAIHALLQQYQAEKKTVLMFQISARALSEVHPGSTAPEVAKHLHPYNYGLSTKKGFEDEKLVTVLWEYPLPKSGNLHPEALTLTDGSLRAAFLTKEAGDLSQYAKHFARVHDRLSGNAHALDDGAFGRVMNGTAYRFKSYFQGIGEGSSMPRFNGSIGANLLLTSLPISAVLYGLLYGIDYGITKHQLAEAKPKEHKPSVSSNGSTYSVSS